MIDSWTCHVCGELRPDVFISVRINDKSEEYCLPPGTFQENIRYCNDIGSCIEGSKNHSHFKNKPTQVVETKEKNKTMKAKYIYTFLIFFLILMILNPTLAVLIREDAVFMEELFEPSGLLIRFLAASFLSNVYANKIFKDNIE